MLLRERRIHKLHLLHIIDEEKELYHRMNFDTDCSQSNTNGFMGTCAAKV
jgi:hypothetical protein